MVVELKLTLVLMTVKLKSVISMDLKRTILASDDALDTAHDHRTQNNTFCNDSSAVASAYSDDSYEGNVREMMTMTTTTTRKMMMWSTVIGDTGVASGQMNAFEPVALRGNLAWRCNLDRDGEFDVVVVPLVVVQTFVALVSIGATVAGAVVMMMPTRVVKRSFFPCITKSRGTFGSCCQSQINNNCLPKCTRCFLL